MSDTPEANRDSEDIFTRKAGEYDEREYMQKVIEGIKAGIRLSFGQYESDTPTIKRRITTYTNRLFKTYIGSETDPDLTAFSFPLLNWLCTIGGGQPITKIVALVKDQGQYELLGLPFGRPDNKAREEWDGFLSNAFDMVGGLVRTPFFQELALYVDEVERLRKEAAAGIAAQTLESASRIAKARETGAITSLNGRAAYATSEDLLLALTRGSLYLLPENIDSSSFDERGRLIPLSLRGEKLEQRIDRAQTGLFGAVLQAVLRIYTPELQDNNSVTLYVPTILRELKIDPRTYSKRREAGGKQIGEARKDKVFELLQPFDRVVGMFPDGKIYRFLAFQSYDPETETVTVSTPYLFELARRNDPNRYTFLAHADIANEPNQAAVEIAIRLLQGLARRGTTTPDKVTSESHGKNQKPTKRKKTIKKPDGEVITIEATYPKEEADSKADKERKEPPTFTYDITYKSIIAECPQIRYELERIVAATDQGKPITQSSNKPLRRHSVYLRRKPTR